MAVVWAKSNGNWSTATLWAFWDENTQQIDDYGQTPQVDDVVYLNGYIVQVNVATYTYLQVREIRNDLNPYTARIGGFVDIMNNISQTQAMTIVANFFGKGITSNDMIFRNGIDTDATRQNVNFTITGNLKDCYLLQDKRGYANNSFIIGNVIDSYLFFNQSGGSAVMKTLTINGNVNNSVVGNNINNVTLNVNGNVDNVNKPSLMTGSGTRTCRINGRIFFYAITNYMHTITLNGVADISRMSYDESVAFPFANGYGLVKNTNLTIITPHLTDYPAENDVKRGVTYAFGNLVGTLNSVIVGCVTKEDVREGVELIGLQEVGTLVVPSVDDVREGVVFDNGSVGTLIVEGGGDRLRIANFGYYTDAQSDTYIVDLTEQDKPKFAVAEERVLIEMFPELDFDNIPDKYFDDLFVKYLKYRLIVEYYRTAGINSTFSTSEPTTEIVNYRNVNCEIWMNIANTYLKAWGEKYPNSIKKQRILL